MNRSRETRSIVEIEDKCFEPAGTTGGQDG